VVRSPRDGKIIWNWDEYKNSQSKGDQEDLKAKRKRTLTLRFTERIAGNDLAVEVGIYKTSYLLPDGKTMDYYGRFHVVLRKENGTWKILVDTDSTENGTIAEKDFLAAKSMN
jgi:ketosteroid isomerase-like protein